MKIFLVLVAASLIIISTMQATEVKEKIGSYMVEFDTVLNVTAQNNTINGDLYALRINYTIPEGWKFGEIDIEHSDDVLTLDELATHFEGIIHRLGYIPQDRLYQKIDSHDSVAIPCISSGSLIPAYYFFSYWFDNETLVSGWVSYELEDCETIADCYRMQNQLPLSLRTFHVTKV